MTAVDPHTDSRPEARAFKVEDLIRYARAGRIRVPPFQRDFKWERDDVEKLIDSILRGYPIGTMLLWSRKGLAGQVTLGDVTFDVNERTDAWVVVDGQQRIVSLVSTLLPGHRRADKFDLYFDLERAEVAHARRGAMPSTALPLNRVVDSEDLLAWLDEFRAVLKPDQVRLAVRAGKLLREYEVPAYVVDVTDESIVRKIFERTNTTGKPLVVSEVFNALHATLDRNPPVSLKDVVERLRARSLGELDEDYVLRSLLAIEGKDRSGDLQRQLADVDIAASVGRVERALDHVFGFLAQDAGIPHLRLLPYMSPLAVLSAFFDRFPTPSNRARRLLTGWLWRGTASEELRGDGKGMRPALEALRTASSDEAAAVGILKTVSSSRPETQPAAAFNLRHARPRVLAMLLARLRPQDLRTGEPLDVSALLSSNEDVFPQILTHKPESLPASEESVFSSIGNRLLHPPVKGLSFFPALQQWTGSQLPLGLAPNLDAHVLVSHGLGLIETRLLQSGDRSAFLTARRNRLEAETTRLIDSRSEWDHSDRPSIAALSANEE